MKRDTPTPTQRIWILADAYVEPEQFVEWPRRRGTWLQRRMAEVKLKEQNNDSTQATKGSSLR
jgi:hypothetical protein